MKTIFILVSMIYDPSFQMAQIGQIETYSTEKQCMADLKMFAPELQINTKSGKTIELRCIAYGVKE